MSEKKKDLSAFLKKNQKKGKKESVTTATVEEKNIEEVESSTQEDATKKATQKKAESSDEEVDDEHDLETQAMSYGNIKEKKDITTNEKQEESENKGYGFDTSAANIPYNDGVGICGQLLQQTVEGRKDAATCTEIHENQGSLR